MSFFFFASVDSFVELIFLKFTRQNCMAALCLPATIAEPLMLLRGGICR